MKYLLLLNIILFGFYISVAAQTKAELEAKRNKTLNEIKYVDELLRSTEKKKNESLNSIAIIKNKVNLRESVIKEMNNEISLTNERIELNNIAIEMMEEDLVELKSDYTKAIVNSYKCKKENRDLFYILSAKNFNQSYKRFKYLKQMAIFRRNQAEVILELKRQVETTKGKLKNDLDKISDLKSNEERQKQLLQSEQERKKKMVKSLAGKEKDLKRELDAKRKIAKKIENEIARLIEEERKKDIKSNITPESKLIGENFEESKGKLPWPVEKGVITSHFGIQRNPDLKYLTEENIGIEITGYGKTKARAVFKGEVVKIFAISGANMTVIIRHGKFLSVYANIVNLKVKTGEKVSIKQEIGDVYSDPNENYNCVLKFMIFETKYLDPELWILNN